MRARTRSAIVCDLTRDWVENRGWPVHDGIRLGPVRCGIGRCRKLHAYVRSIVRKDTAVSWVYERPCDTNAPQGADRARP